MSDVFAMYEKEVRPMLMPAPQPEPEMFELQEEQQEQPAIPNEGARKPEMQITEEMKAALFEEFKAMMANEGKEGTNGD